jgi:ferric-dicitrate binding protein FerR (iron transport regulator)
MNRKQQAIEDSATEWLGRRDGGLTPAEEKEWSEWLRADPCHLHAYRELEAVSRALDGLSILKAARRVAPDANLPLKASRSTLA